MVLMWTWVVCAVPTIAKNARRLTPKSVFGLAVMAMVCGQLATTYDEPPLPLSADVGRSCEASFENTLTLSSG